jgi:phospholipid/cholesterol/gamma-HCH transport system substrate-binding protein
MNRNVVETVLGAIVLLVAAVFLVFSYNTANVKKITGYEITADFSSTGGLKAGDDIMVSGVKVGTVTDIKLDSETYLARVHMSIDPFVKLPLDTAALITSESIMGGRYLALEPGAEEEMIEAGGRVPYTQAPQNLEQLLGQFIFNMRDDKSGT